MAYIKQEDAIETIHRYFNELLNLLPTQTNGGYEVYLNTERVNALLGENKALCELIKGLPSADVVERKKGKWIEVGGFATPGGDPVWCCSECLKGLHVWGIEHSTYGGDIADNQWVACPNCGADMREAKE